MSSAGSDGHAELPGLSALAVNQGLNESLLSGVSGTRVSLKSDAITVQIFLVSFSMKSELLAPRLTTASGTMP